MMTSSLAGFSRKLPFSLPENQNICQVPSTGLLSCSPQFLGFAAIWRSVCQCSQFRGGGGDGGWWFFKARATTTRLLTSLTSLGLSVLHVLRKRLGPQAAGPDPSRSLRAIRETHTSLVLSILHPPHLEPTSSPCFAPGQCRLLFHVHPGRCVFPFRVRPLPERRFAQGPRFFFIRIRCRLTYVSRITLWSWLSLAAASLSETDHRIYLWTLWNLTSKNRYCTNGRLATVIKAGVRTSSCTYLVVATLDCDSVMSSHQHLDKQASFSPCLQTDSGKSGLWPRATQWVNGKTKTGTALGGSRPQMLPWPYAVTSSLKSSFSPFTTSFPMSIHSIYFFFSNYIFNFDLCICIEV